MRTCKNCKYRVSGSRQDVCSANEVYEFKWTRNPYTGRIETETLCNGHVLWLRPSVIERRAVGAECGPDAKLWEPRWSTRLWRWLTGNQEGEG